MGRGGGRSEQRMRGERGGGEDIHHIRWVLMTEVWMVYLPYQPSYKGISYPVITYHITPHVSKCPEQRKSINDITP